MTDINETIQEPHYDTGISIHNAGNKALCKK
jgi:hypothetical protein